jgi:MYXO-CTERM domain-containing protein
MRMRRCSWGAIAGLVGVFAAVGTARAQNTVAGVCQRWVCDRADMTEGTSTADISTCTIGDLTGEGRPNSLKAVNLYRFLTGMPEVTEDPGFDSMAQACSIIQAANGLSHTPTTTDTCYNAVGASASNMSSICGGASVGCIDLYMNDSGNSGFGHRTWIFSNLLGPVGFGQTGSGGRTMTASCFYQTGGTGKAGIPFVPWPPSGPVPLAAITATMVDSAGWSVQSDTINLTTATATVMDGTTSLPVTVTPNLPRFGAKYAMEILPTGWTSQAGHNYAVTVGGTTTPLAYTVQVADCTGYTTAGCASDGGVILADAGGGASSSSGGGSSGSSSSSGGGSPGTSSSSGGGAGSGSSSGGGAGAGSSGGSGSGSGSSGGGASADASTAGNPSGADASTAGASGFGADNTKPGCSCATVGATATSRGTGWFGGLALLGASRVRRRRSRRSA